METTALKVGMEIEEDDLCLRSPWCHLVAEQDGRKVFQGGKDGSLLIEWDCSTHKILSITERKEKK